MTKHAIVIGIGPSKIAEHELKGAATDAERVSKFLLGEDGRVELLERDPWTVFKIAAHHKRDTTGRGAFLRAAFDDWWALMHEEPAEELHLLIYFAGHATPLASGEVELLGIDDPWMTLSELASRMVDSPARNVTVILDCCHSGALEDKLRILLAEPGTNQLGRGVLAACAVDQQAYSYGEMGGLFTTVILNGLGADEGGVVQDKITATALNQYVMANWDDVHKKVASRQGPVGMVRLPRGPDIPIVELVRRPVSRPGPADIAHSEPRPELLTIESSRRAIQAERTRDGVRISWIVRPTGAQRPWLALAPLDPSERLLAITTTLDRSAALLAVSGRDATRILRVRPDGKVSRFVVPGTGASTRATFGEGREFGTMLLTSTTGEERRVNLASETVVEPERAAP